MSPTDEQLDRIDARVFIVPLSLSRPVRRALIRAVVTAFVRDAKKGWDRERVRAHFKLLFERGFRETIRDCDLEEDRDQETLRAILSRLETALCDELAPQERAD